MARFTQLETRRLRLRRLCPDDLAALHAYRKLPEVARYQSWERYTKTDARALIRSSKHGEPGTPGEWFQFAIETKANAELAGDCGLLTNPDGRSGHVGYTIRPQLQGKGLAKEAVGAVLDLAFETLRFERIQAECDPRNLASWKLLERLGFHCIRRMPRAILLKGEWCDSYVYELLARDWQKR